MVDKHAEPPRYTFLVEWCDGPSDVPSKLHLFCYEDDTMELWDVVSVKLLLKRDTLPGVIRSDVYVGNRLPAFGRTLAVTGYGDIFTKKTLEPMYERTLALIKPDAFTKIGEIVEIIIKNGFEITKAKMVTMKANQVIEFYQNIPGHPLIRALVQLMQSGFVFAMEIQGPRAGCRWLELMGPMDPVIAKLVAPTSVRSLFGTSKVKNAVHGSATLREYKRELNIFFDVHTLPPVHGICTTSADPNLVAVCIIKPNTVLEGNWPRILINLVAKKFIISAVQMFFLDRHHAAEYLCMYSELPEYKAMIEQLAWGPCIVVAVGGFGRCTGSKLREVSGHPMPLMGVQHYPETIRVNLGKLLLKNPVHCTDVVRDGGPDVRYFFYVLGDKFM